MSMLLSKEFEEAMEAEFNRLLDERMESYEDSEKYYKRLDAAVSEEMDGLGAWLTCTPKLAMVLSSEDGHSKRYINLENLLQTEISEAVAGDDTAVKELKMMLKRLELMASAIRDVLPKLRRPEV